MEKTLFFYDLETSGLSVLDQILSFAGIRVDAQTLEEITSSRKHICLGITYLEPLPSASTEFYFTVILEIFFHSSCPYESYEATSALHKGRSDKQ